MAAQEKKDKIEPNQNPPNDYGCQILLEKTTLEQAKDFSFPSDAYLIWYVENGKEYLDLTRCNKKVQLFDMYYDKYGPGSIQKIDFSYGRVNPRIWGIKKPEKKKRR
jgi:hypothetical protein